MLGKAKQVNGKVKKSSSPKMQNKAASAVATVNNKKESKRYTAESVVMTSARKPESQMTTMEKMHATQEGISKKQLEQLKEKAGLDYDQLSYILGVARATLI